MFSNYISVVDLSQEKKRKVMPSLNLKGLSKLISSPSQHEDPSDAQQKTRCDVFIISDNVSKSDQEQ